MKYSLFFRFRIWGRRWFMNRAGWQTARYNQKLYKEADRWIENPNRLSTLGDGHEEGILSRRVKDLNLVRQSIQGEGHHRG